jgi:hypothetical protein
MQDILDDEREPAQIFEVHVDLIAGQLLLITAIGGIGIGLLYCFLTLILGLLQYRLERECCEGRIPIVCRYHFFKALFRGKNK